MQRKGRVCRFVRAERWIYAVERRDGEERIARGGPHLPRMTAETGRVSTYDPIAPRVELATA